MMKRWSGIFKKKGIALRNFLNLIALQRPGFFKVAPGNSTKEVRMALNLSATIFIIGLFFGMADCDSLHLFIITKIVALALMGVSVAGYLCAGGVVDEIRN